MTFSRDALTLLRPGLVMLMRDVMLTFIASYGRRGVCITWIAFVLGLVGCFVFTVGLFFDWFDSSFMFGNFEMGFGKKRAIISIVSRLFCVLTTDNKQTVLPVRLKLIGLKTKKGIACWSDQDGIAGKLVNYLIPWYIWLVSTAGNRLGRLVF